MDREATHQDEIRMESFQGSPSGQRTFSAEARQSTGYSPNVPYLLMTSSSRKITPFPQFGGLFVASKASSQKIEVI